MADDPTLWTSARGFIYTDEVFTEYGDAVRVYESSAASGPRIWLGVEGTVHADPDSIQPDWVGAGGEKRRTTMAAPPPT